MVMTEAESFNPLRLAPKCWRLTDPDIDRLMTWLPMAFKERWPNLDADNLRFFLRQMLADNTCAIFCTENACGMAYVQRDVFEPQGVVYEKFVRGGRLAEEVEKQAIVIAMRDWAQAIHAREFVFNLDSDARINQTSRGPGTKTVLQNVRKRSRVLERSYHIAVFDGKEG